MAESKLTSALIAALEDPKSAGDRIQDVSQEAAKSAGEAELIVRLLKLFPLPPGSSAERAVGSPLRDVLVWMQGAKDEDEEAVAVFRELGAPELLRIFDEMIRLASPDNQLRAKDDDDLLFLLKVVCLYAPKGGLERLVTAVRSPLLKKGYLWSVIFEIVSNDRHPWQTDIVEALRDPLPDGFTAVTYLELSNAVARSGKLARHPFDTEAGLALLQAWLLDKERADYGHSAAASIPFLSPQAREKVQALADQHPNRAVQLEAAWAAAASGEARGYQALQAACADPREASAAMQYLTELGAEDRIPLHASSADFKAISEMCEWRLPRHLTRLPCLAPVQQDELCLSVVCQYGLFRSNFKFQILNFKSPDNGCFAMSIRRARARRSRTSATGWSAQLHSPCPASPHPASPPSKYTGCTVPGSWR
jgi:hypothetical protein